MTHVDLFFHVVGETVPIDHGYALYGAICKTMEEAPGTESWLHAAEDIGLIPIRGTASGDHRLILNRDARFGLRLPASEIPRALPLAGRRLRIGNTTVRVGAVTTEPLIPAAALYARIVTTRNGEEPARFDAEIARQLTALGVRGKAERGRRRIITISNKRVVGHELLVTELTAEESILLQENGLGGRRKMGAGVFVPVSAGQRSRH